MYKKINIGFFGDKKWAYNSLLLILRCKNIQVKFVCLRKNMPDYNLAKLAKKKKIKSFIFDDINSDHNFNIIKSYNLDLIVSVSYDQIFRKRLIDHLNLKLGIINCHAGDLPFYRGRSPLNWAIINDEKFFGITVHYINEKIDEGDILIKKKFPIKDNMDFNDILNKAYIECPKLTMKAINLIVQGRVDPKKQSAISKKGSYYKKRLPGDENINWNDKSRNIFCFVRGLSKPSIVARTFLNKKEIKIYKVCNRFKLINKNYQPGTILKVYNKSFVVKTGDYSIRVKKWKGKIRELEKLY